jgi:hypothetical protein
LTLVETFASLFSGRLDAVGGDEGRAIYKPYTTELVEAHLNGIEPIGVYPTWPDEDGRRWTRWGCCDIDTGDWSEAYMLATALKGMGLVPHVERSRSKGWHIWVFVREPVEAWQMRRCLKVAYAAIDLPAKEANPKSEQLAPSQLGNYVRLPYPGAAVLHKDRQVMMRDWCSTDDGVPCTLERWLTWPMFSDRDRVIHWASKWYERPRRTTTARAGTPDEATKLVGRLDVSWRNIYETGETRDRSAAFVALAHWCANRGWNADDTFTLLWWCAWNKYADRQDGESYVRDIVERAYG